MSGLARRRRLLLKSLKGRENRDLQRGRHGGKEAQIAGFGPNGSMGQGAVTRKNGQLY
jgi:hypothetical protein